MTLKNNYNFTFPSYIVFFFFFKKNKNLIKDRAGPVHITVWVTGGLNKRIKYKVQYEIWDIVMNESNVSENHTNITEDNKIHKAR